MAGSVRTSKRSTTRVVLTVVAVLLGVLGTVGWRWYSYVTAGESPYDEVGIELNSRAPSPLRTWGCTRLADRFPGSVPPYGC